MSNHDPDLYSTQPGARTPLLILGLGNVLCADDGAGVVAVARLLQRWQGPNGVRILDGGTLGLALLPELQDADRAIAAFDAGEKSQDIEMLWAPEADFLRQDPRFPDLVAAARLTPFTAQGN